MGGGGGAGRGGQSWRSFLLFFVLWDDLGFYFYWFQRGVHQKDPFFLSTLNRGPVDVMELLRRR